MDPTDDLHRREDPQTVEDIRELLCISCFTFWPFKEKTPKERGRKSMVLLSIPDTLCVRVDSVAKAP